MFKNTIKESLKITNLPNVIINLCSLYIELTEEEQIYFSGRDNWYKFQIPKKNLIQKYVHMQQKMDIWK